MSRTSVGRVELRVAPRAPICVRVLVLPKEREPAEHLSLDLSIAGIRLCGRPLAQIGDATEVWLYFGQNTVARVSGEIVRISEAPDRPEFAIRFESFPEDSRQLIQQKVDAALLGSVRPSVMLLEMADDPNARGSWPDSLPSRCRVVTTNDIDRVRDTFAKHPIETAVVTSRYHETLAEWAVAFPDVSWRSIDAHGQLRG